MKNPPVHALVPLKNLKCAKSRLKGALTDVQRIRLARAMATDTILALLQCPHIGSVSIVSSDNDIRGMAFDLGARSVSDLGGGLNGALANAVDELLPTVTGRILVVPGDLPFLTADAVAQFVENAEFADVGIAVAGSDRGTNGLLLPRNGSTLFCFGPDSAVRHAEYARNIGYAVTSLTQSGFTNDIDTASDLHHLIAQRHNAGKHTQIFLNALVMDAAPYATLEF